MDTFVQFTQDVGSWSKDAIVSIPDGIARAYIAAGQAKESDAISHLKASNEAQMRTFQSQLLETIEKSLGKTPSKGPPNGNPAAGEKVNQGEFVSSGPPGKRGIGEAMKCVFLAQAMDTPPELREWSRNMLTKVYSDQTVNYKVTDDGNISETVERNGMSVTRTGTESISGGPTYGFAIKPEWSDNLFRIPMEESVIEGSAFEVPVGTGLEFKWPALDQYKTPIAGQSASYAGFQLSRKGEITQRQYTDAALSMIEFKMTDLTAFTTLSRDLVADNYIRMDAMVQQVLGDAFQWKKDYEYINGQGIGSPTGYLNATALLTRTRSNANKISYEDIVTMLSYLHPACWKDARWITNVTTLPQLVAIQNAAGTYVYQPNSMIAQYMRPPVMGNPGDYNDRRWRAQGMLEGLPVFFTEKVPTLGTQGDLSLIHPRSYGVATRSGLEIGLSEHFLFDTDTVAFRFKLRNDAKPLWRAPYIQSDGGNTSATKVSPFVVLK